MSFQTVVRAAFRILLKGGGGKMAVYRILGGAYIVKFQGEETLANWCSHFSAKYNKEKTGKGSS